MVTGAQGSGGIAYDELAALKVVGDAVVDPAGARIAYAVAESGLAIRGDLRVRQ